jgi:hypothetical protein
MSVLIQDFDQHEKRILVTILHELKNHQRRGGAVDREDITVVVEGIRTRIGKPNHRDTVEAINKMTKRTYTTFDPTNYTYFQGKPLFSELTYDARKGKVGDLVATINPKLHDAWLNLSNGYTPQFLHKCLVLKGKYAPALYDFICKYDIPKVITWKDLRAYLAIESEYTDWQSFKKGVLARSQRQIATATYRTFNWKIVRGERNDNMEIKRIKIWGEVVPKNIPKEDCKILMGLIKRLGYEEHKQKDLIKEFIFEHYVSFVEEYNKMVGSFRGGTVLEINQKEIGLRLLRKYRIG